ILLLSGFRCGSPNFYKRSECPFLLLIFRQIFYKSPVRNIILACEPQWVEKELEMDVSLEKVTFVGDEDLMSQVWTNLIHNSIKFTPSLGRICVQLQQIEHKAIVKISDTGIGIPKEDQVRVFERFFKADRARERSKGGSGLGLSIVKKIIEMHEGTIFVNSEEGKGTIFTISIPIQSHLETSQ
ncbi:ATP-binding protein, partial [Aneurinibacillus migulanus]|uniref:sensor histidine kinase n=3 Tax=Aneurinibacillus migulanus TaxID=47500 RepID=UPI002E1D167F|nr:ATP-binding protein [Aneurinibacillus migulanus]